MQIIFNTYRKTPFIKIEGTPPNEIDLGSLSKKMMKENICCLIIRDTDNKWNFVDLQFLHFFAFLEKLSIYVTDCNPTLIEKYLKNIKCLEIGIRQKKTLMPIENLTDIVSLSFFHNVVEIKHSLKNLKNIGLSGTNLSKIDFSLLESLKNLNMDPHCFGFSESNLASLSSLEAMTMTMAYDLKDLSFLSELKNLRALHLYWLPRLKMFPDISKLNNLTRVWLSSIKFNDISGLSSSSSIEELFIGCNISADMLRPLLQIPSLKKVSLSLANNSETRKGERMFGELIDNSPWEPYYIE